MLEGIKKLDKKYLALLLFFVVLTTLVPLKFAQAQVQVQSGLEAIFSRAIQVVLVGSMDIVMGLFGIAFMVIQFITGIGPLIGSEFLSAVIIFTQNIGLTPAHADPNPALVAGWQFTRNLANITFVLILAWSAFATILRIRTYEVKKILPKLLIIALLINFIPVITGVILDITGVITGFFVGKSSGAGQWLWAANPIENIKNTIGDNWRNIISAPGGLTGMAIQSFAGIVFNVISFGILIGYALIFLIRVVVIWILVILAPLAWLGYIIPAGKKWWNMWWNQFILWAIIGIPMLFFLYIAGLLLQSGMTAGMTVCTIDLAKYPSFIQGPIASALGPMLCKSYAFIAAIVILIFGMGLSMSLAPKFASSAFAFAKKGMRKGRNAIADRTLGRAAATDKGKSALKKIRGFGFGLPNRPFTKEGRTEWKDKFKKTGIFGKAGMIARTGLAPATLGLRWATRQAAEKGLEYGREQPKLVDAEVKKLDNSNVYYKDAISDYGTIAPSNWKKRLATVLYATKKKGAKGLNEFIKKYEKKELNDVIRLANRYAPAKVEDIVKHMPDLIDDKDIGQLVINNMVSDGLDDEDVKKLVAVGVDTADAVKKAAFKKAVDALKPIDIETLSEDTIQDKDFQEMVVRFKPWNFIRKLIDEKGLDYGEKLQNMVESENIGVKNILKTNPTFIRASTTPAGQMYLRSFTDEGGFKLERREHISPVMDDAIKEFRKQQSEVELKIKVEKAKGAKATGTTTKKAGRGGGTFS